MAKPSRVRPPSAWDMTQNGEKDLRRCERCNGNLPCVKCARAMRKELGLVGKEPMEEEIALDEYELEQARLLEEATKKIRDEGFVGRSNHSNREAMFYPPWDENTHRDRFGLPNTEYEFPHSDVEV